MPTRSALVSAFSRLFSWPRKLFWTFTLALLLTSLVSTIGVIGVLSWGLQTQLREGIASPAFDHAIKDAYTYYRYYQAGQSDRGDACGVIKRILTRNLYEQKGIVREGHIDFQDIVDQGRLVVMYADSQGQCSAPAHADPTLVARMTEFQSRVGPQPASEITRPERFGPWHRIVSFVPGGQDSAIVTVGLGGPGVMQALTNALGRGLAWIVPYTVASCCINALILVGFLLRRIRRAESTAAQWAGGNLDARINDSGKDEFRQLADNFDTMADALNNLIRVKQTLAASEERNRLARDLHDTAKQRCFALGLQLSILRKQHHHDPASLRLTESALALTRHLQDDLRNIIERLSAPTVSELGLARAVQESLDVLLSGHNMALDVSVPEPAARALAAYPEIGVELMVIALEAASNAARHSHASRLSITLRQDDERMRWTIRDDGVGFVAEDHAGDGMGLTNIRHRAQALPNGTLSIGRAGEPGTAGAGTAIVVTFDLPGKSKSERPGHPGAILLSPIKPSDK